MVILLYCQFQPTRGNVRDGTVRWDKEMQAEMVCERQGREENLKEGTDQVRLGQC